MSHKVLIVDDDEVTSAWIAEELGMEGIEVASAQTGSDGFSLAVRGGYDAIVLDRMLPQMDGMMVVTKLRAAGVDTPVLFLSALGSTDERVAGLTAGSDDYLAKPFAMSELLARVRILMRRSLALRDELTHLTCDDLEMNVMLRKVSRGGCPVNLQPREFRLLEFLLRHAEQVVTRTMLLEGVWDYYFDPGTNLIDVHISRLRRKIDDGHPRQLLHTVRGSGYSLGAAP